MLETKILKVLILGGDGYLGWPTAMHLSMKGHDVAVADNYLRRRLCQEEDVDPLFGVPNLNERARLWEDVSMNRIKVFIGDLTKWEFVYKLFHEFLPDSIVHFAEQPSAPYSMIHRHGAIKNTLLNNLLVTSNLIYAVKEFCPKTQIVKLGTMGEYGTPNIDIEEGWLDVEHKGRKQKFLYPRQASSLYHTTKIMDTDLLWFYVRTWGLCVTDLMQGPVYGLVTDETESDDRLMPFFNYDELFGTVLNRFVVQAVVGHPLTVYGSGRQVRGYLNIKDTLNCVRLSVENPAKQGELRIFNQFIETFSVYELARKVKRVGDPLDLNVEIKSIKNPRIEAEEHYYNPVHTGLFDLGLEPHLLTDEALRQIMETVIRYKDHIKTHSIYRGVTWK
jgi:UDP-sulfoquinovose synthase